MTESYLRNPHGLSLTVVVTREESRTAFEARLAPHDNASVALGRWEDLPPHGCFATAGNAFGIMNAGIDAVVVKRFGTSVQQQVQERILDQYHGEQPIGSAFLVETGHGDVPYLCHAPTMRVPRGISGTDNVYRAARACFLAVGHHNRVAEDPIETLVLPAFGAGFGGMPVDEVARQTAVAWQLFDEVPFRPDWDRIIRREQLICMDGEERRVTL